MSMNIFEIWNSIGRKTPFAVRRDNWSEEYYTIVERIECERMPYGKAFGIATINGVHSDHYKYDKMWLEEKIIPCCGCYQWELAEEAEVNKDNIMKSPPEKKIKVSAYSLDSKFTFGKYKNAIIKDVLKEDPQYILWSLVNVEKFCLVDEAVKEFETFDPPIILPLEAHQKNAEKLLLVSKKLLLKK